MTIYFSDIIQTIHVAGDTWLQEVVWHLLHPDQLQSEKASIGQRVPHLDHAFFGTKLPKHFFLETPPPRVFKSRLPARMLYRHLTGKVKVIFWTMDPREMLVKYHDFYNNKGKILNFPPIDFNHFFKLFQEQQLFEGDWFDTTLSFLPYVNNDNFLFLRQEEAAKDLRGTVRKLAQFLEIDVSDGQLTDVEKVAPFDDVGGWQRYISEEQLQWYRRKYAQMMADTILESTYL